MLATELVQVIDTPCHDQVDSQASFESSFLSQLTLFDATAALRRPMQHFDARRRAYHRNFSCACSKRVARSVVSSSHSSGLTPAEACCSCAWTA